MLTTVYSIGLNGGTMKAFLLNQEQVKYILYHIIVKHSFIHSFNKLI